MNDRSLLMNTETLASTMFTTMAGLWTGVKSSSAGVRFVVVAVSEVKALEIGRMNCMNADETLLFFVR